MIREIVTLGDPVLRERAREIRADELGSPAMQVLIDDLVETRRAAHGAGLAANQVGEALRVAVVEVEPGNPRYPYKPAIPLTVLVNPVIEALGEQIEVINEGCLSVPGVRAQVPRSMAVRVRYLDRDGNERAAEARGLTAGTFQHEIDHLDGTLILDRTDPSSRHELGGVRARPAPGLRAACGADRGALRLVKRRLWCELAWLGGEAAESGVAIEVDGERIASVTTEADAAPDDERLPGLTIPGLANAHSHAFHRALRGQTQSGRGSFWTWREQMYALAERLDPESYLKLARATFAEMALGGITAVGEFHYLHHASGGKPYDDPNEIGKALVEAASEAGIRITLIDACYLHGGVGRELDRPQQRFADADAGAWAERVRALDLNEGAILGAAIHSVRAVDPDSAAVVAAFAAERDMPLHAHVSEQPAENAACAERYGRTPSEVLLEAGALGARFTAVHATHLTDSDIELLGGAGCTCCLCPTTERDLADGIGPSRQLADAGARLALGSDSHAVVDHFEEARAVELDQRLESGERGRHGPAALLRAATAAGHAAIGRADAGRIEPGALADLTTVGLDSVRLAGTTPASAVDSVVFAASAADVTDVMVGGRAIVRDGAHLELDVAAELVAAVNSLRSMSTLVIDNIGLLVTNDPAAGEGALGVVRDAAVVCENGRVASVESAGAAADERLDADGRCVIPGFVDSHTHLVFAGDRADEFAARMAGAEYEAGGIRVTTDATRAASTEELTELAKARRDEGLRAGITHVEVKSGYGLEVETEERSCQVAAGLTDDVTFLGAHVVPAEYEGYTDEYVRLVCGEMLEACAPRCRWIDVFCERGAFNEEQSRAVLEAGRKASLGLRVHGNQLGRGPGARLAAELGAASVDHCTYLGDADIEALADSETFATFLPATDFSTRQPYPDARRAIDAGVNVALATNTNPGSSYTTSMAFCIALAVRDMGMSTEEALRAATLGGAGALRREDVGALRPGCRADAVILDAPSYTHLVYRPGVPLVKHVVSEGSVVSV